MTRVPLFGCSERRATITCYGCAFIAPWFHWGSQGSIPTLSSAGFSSWRSSTCYGQLPEMIPSLTMPNWQYQLGMVNCAGITTNTCPQRFFFKTVEDRHHLLNYTAYAFPLQVST